MSIDTQTTIQAIVDRWFLSEPLLFAAYCGHKLVPNNLIQCAFRSGRRRIEYNPKWLARFNALEIGELLRREVIRIVLKHPYERLPVNAYPEILFVASNITIFEHRGTSIVPYLWMPMDLPGGLSFEEYYNLLSHQLPPQPPIISSVEESGNQSPEDGVNSDKSHSSDENGEHDKKAQDPSDIDSDNEFPYGSSHNAEKNTDVKKRGSNQSLRELKENGADGSELWGEDEVQIEYINGLIENAMLTNRWGSVPGNLKDLIKASTIKSMNIRRRLDMFRTSIISTNRQLTRMRPSRRYGWTQMGARYPYTSCLLIAVDTSGSIEGEDLERFFGVVNSFFTYGIPHIDVIQFDAKLHFPLLSLDKVTNKIELRGGGGTDFQPVVDYFAEHKEYDGMLVFTDGYATTPTIPHNRKILWVLKDMPCYKNCKLEPKVYI